MKRPTIKDVAEHAQVSAATVNRVLAGAESVRSDTRERVFDAAAAIGFYGTSAIRDRNVALRPKVRLGVLLLQPKREFYRLIAEYLRAAAEATTSVAVDLRIEHLEDLSPENTALRMTELAKNCDAICVTSAVHFLVTQAIDQIQQHGVPVFALIAQLSATGQIHYVGLDNWKVGRTAGWAFANICRKPGKIGILLGNHRYRNQEMNEAGCRSFFREHAPEFSLLDPLPTYESSSEAYTQTKQLIADHPDLRGIFVAGGGISGTVKALRENPASKSLVVVGFELMGATREALLDDTLRLVIAHPLQKLAQATIQGMVQAATEGTATSNFTRIVPFDIITRENI